jgi:hypothetical protein
VPSAIRALSTPLLKFRAAFFMKSSPIVSSP